MVIFHRITFCPFEWPDRDICVSVEHSVFVSGEKMPGEQITMDYELTSNNLKNMWEREELLEIIKLGLMVWSVMLMVW